MGLMEKSEKLGMTMKKYQAMADGKISLDLVTKEQVYDDLKLISEIALMLSNKLVQIDNEVVGWEVASKLIEDSESPFFAGAHGVLENNIDAINRIMDSDT